MDRNSHERAGTRLSAASAGALLTLTSLLVACGAEPTAPSVSPPPTEAPAEPVAAVTVTPTLTRTEVPSLDPTPIAPTSSILIGPAGVDDRGEPRQSVDPLVFQALLQARRFEDLCREIGALQDAFEADVTRERWPMEAFEAFNAVFPSSWELHDAWVEATPDCFAAHAARGTFLQAIGLTIRGRATVDRVASANLELMGELLARSEADLRRALELRPRLVAVVATLEAVLSATGRTDEVVVVFDEALRTCPDCLELRLAHLRNSRARWGGEVGRIQAVIDGVEASRRPGLGMFTGYLHYDECYELRTARRYDEALAACTSAVDASGYWRYFFERGRVRRAMGDTEGALTDLDRALADRPRAAGPMLERVQALVTLGRSREAAEQLAMLAHLIPDDDRASRLGVRLAPDIARQREEATSTGRLDEAAALGRILHDILLPSDPSRPE